MSSDSECEINCTPPNVTLLAETATNNLLPFKSKERYEIAYQKFMDWKKTNNATSFSETVMLAYFQKLSETMKPSSLWALYSMLRTTISIKHNVNIANYPKLIALLKRKSDGFVSKKSKVLTSKNINDFLNNAPDDKYLFTKVVLIIGVSGACRKQELRNIKLHDIEDTGKSFIINIPNSKTKTQRSFVVSEAFYSTVKQYMKLRPVDNTAHLPFFINYVNGKCTRQCVGINKLASVPKQIAKYLELPDANSYTGHCFRRSSATILVDSGGDLLDLKRHGGWRSSAVAEGYIDSSMNSKTKNSSKITSAIVNNNANENDSFAANKNNITLSCASSSTSTNSPFVFNNCTVNITYYSNPSSS